MARQRHFGKAAYLRFSCSAVFIAVSSLWALSQGMPGQSSLTVVPALAATSTLGGINVEPSARPWQYLGANPDSWWCPVGQCTTSDPLGRIDREMSLAKQLHVANVRLEIPWFLVEPSGGRYTWTRADYIFNSATSHGIQIQPILVYTPRWDGAYDAFPTPANFRAFVTAFMTKYGGKISAVEMWNEPDGGQSLVANDPARYVTDILIPGYDAVKASSHPNVKVIEGGSINDSGGTPNWLNGIYNAGGGKYFDIAAFHDYGGNYAQIVSAYQGVINAHPSDGNKPIWLGEYGVSDSTGAQQSSLIQAALTNTSGLAMAQFYTLRDESVYTCCPPAPTGEHKQYGVVASNDVTTKSSFRTMQAILGGSGSPPQPSPIPKASPHPKPSPAKSSPSPGATTPPHSTPSPTNSGAVHTPTPSDASPSPGDAGAGLAGNSSAAQPPAGGTGNSGGPQILYFAILLAGVLGFVLGFALLTNVGTLATRIPGLRRSIQSRSSTVGFGVATGGAVACLFAILLLNQLPGSG